MEVKFFQPLGEALAFSHALYFHLLLGQVPLCAFPAGGSHLQLIQSWSKIGMLDLL